MKNWFFVLLPFAALGCGGGDDTAVALKPNPVRKTDFSSVSGVPDNVRFGSPSPSAMAQSAQGNPNAAATAAPSSSGFAFTTPPGWTQLPSSEFRDPNFKLDNVPGGEAYVTLLPGGGGGVAPNLNRWRGQFSLPPLTQPELDALTSATILGAPAVLVDWTGSFKGMAPMTPSAMNPASLASPGSVADAAAPPPTAIKENYRIVGAMINAPAGLITIKMTGPADALRGELENFKAFCASLRMAPADAATVAAPATTPQNPVALPDGHPPLDASSQLPPAPPATDIAWTVPEGWTAGPEKAMRLATFNPASANGATGAVDVSVVMLGGSGGGLVPNVQRWYKQMGRPEPTAEEIAKLPTLDALGVKAPLVEASGSFSGMGRDAVSEAALIGVIFELPGQTLFVKMTGPKDQVLAQRDAFSRFCLSLKRK